MKLIGPTDKPTKRRLSAVAPLALVAFMLAMALLPLAQPRSVVAGDDDIKFNTGIDLVDTSDDPVVIKPPTGGILVTPTKTPVILVDLDDDEIDIDVDDPILIDPTETPPMIDADIDVIDVPTPTASSNSGDGGIYINKHACPAGYDGAQKTFYDLAADCGGASNGIGFLLSDGAQAVQSESTGDVVDSGVEFSGVAAGPYSIVEQVPAGFAAPRVFCDTIEAGQGGSPASFSEQSVLDGNQIFHILGEGEYLYCDWFNFPSDDGDSPIITLPDGTVIDVNQDNPVIDLPSCVDGESVTVHLPEGVDLDLGRRHLKVIDGYRLQSRTGGVYADLLNREHSPDTINFPPSLIIETVEDGIDIIIPLCDDIEEASVDGEVTVSKMACPVGYDAHAADIYDLSLNCTNPLDNIGFILSENGQAINFNKTNASGYAGFGGVPAGEIAIREEIPAGYIEPIVFCQTNDPNVPAPGDTVSVPVTGGDEALVQVPEGGQVNCLWYNVPFPIVITGESGGTIAIRKSACPLGFDAASADVYEFAFACNDPLSDVSFLLSDGGGAIDSGVTDANGDVTFSNVPAIPVSIVEEIPVGYGEPAVFCISNVPGDIEVGDTIQQQVLDGNQIFHLMEEQESLSCTWYNIPATTSDAGDGDGTISIFKGECPVGFDAVNADVYDFAFSCGTAMEGIGFLLSDGAGAIAAAATDANGNVEFTDVPAIPVSIVEDVPAGFGEPVVFCISNVPGDVEVGEMIPLQVLDGNQIFHLMAVGESLSCTWYNVPSEDDGGVVVHKYNCEADPGVSDAMDDHLLGAGCEPQNGVDFTLSYGIDTILPGTTGEDGEGVVAWDGLPATDLHVHEYIPTGYGEPVVYCTSQVPGTPEPLGYDSLAVEDGTVSVSLDENEQVSCWWINLPGDTGTIRIIKYTCDAGYDLFSYGADPSEDCKHRTNGVEFVAEGPYGYDATGITGDSGDKGKTIFADLGPGDYTVHEIVPASTEQVFVLTCEDNKGDQIQGYPLALGSSIDIAVKPGSLIICRWYNVPAEPDYGTIQITKYACAAEYFVDATDCDIYERGADFSLSTKQGNQWLIAASGTTNSAGVLTFSNLAGGEYQIDELNGEWCYATASLVTYAGDLVVAPGEITYVDVYNCGIINVVKKPSKFPNTGVGPRAATIDGASAPVSPVRVAVINPRQWMGVFDERLISFLTVGERPVSIRIATVAIAADTETLEVVDGALQDPTTSDLVAWYKDTAKLGGEGNVVMAGHLNYWGDPEGVFYRLADVQIGDDIVVKGDQGTVYHYRVIWVENVDVQSEELAEIVGPTETPSLTLITCGGEWDKRVQEYNQRTVVRAELVTEAA